MELSPELTTLVITFVAVAAAQLSKGAFRIVANYVRNTPNTLDDKIFAAVVEAVGAVVEDPEDDDPNRDNDGEVGPFK